SPELVAAALVEETEVADARFAHLRGHDMAPVDAGPAIERMQAVGGALVDHPVVGEGVSQDGRVEGRHLRAPRLALGEQVLGVQAPAAPLASDALREVADHAQALAREVPEEA